MRPYRALKGLLPIVAFMGAAHAAPLEEAIMPLERYSSTKARSLAARYSSELRRIYDDTSRCLPWLHIKKHGLGFRKPHGALGDDFYLTLWVWVDQTITPEFTAMSQASRASAMFSRYGTNLLRRLSRLHRLAADRELAGYSVVLSWLKPAGRAEHQGRPTAETLAVFVDTATAQEFLAQTVTPAQFVKQARVIAFEGTSALGRLPLTIWEDGFIGTFRPKDSTPGDCDSDQR
ncbi:MAG: hypothetical protein ACE5JN_01350 [Candidatus Methylomirabilia bacterium]